MALLIFALAGMLEGSGFLAVFVAGLIAGNAASAMRGVKRFQNGLTWLSQIVMFLTLGLLASPSQFPSVAVTAIGIAVVLDPPRAADRHLALPPAVPLHEPRAHLHRLGRASRRDLDPARDRARHRRAVLRPGDLQHRLHHRPDLAARAGLDDRADGALAEAAGAAAHRAGGEDRAGTAGRGHYEIVTYIVHPESPVAKGQRIPRWARPSLLIRNGRSLRADRSGRPEAGDQIYVLTTPNFISLLDGLSRDRSRAPSTPSSRRGRDRAQTRLADLAATYDARVAPEDAEMTVAELLSALAGDIEQGDRIPYGPIDLIVRSVDDEHRITDVGLALEQHLLAAAADPAVPGPEGDRRSATVLARVVASAKGRSAGRAQGAPAGRRRGAGRLPVARERGVTEAREACQAAR